MRKSLRTSGINIIGDVPWGTHFCQFYQTKADLIEIVVPYFKAGLENNEFCLWVIPELFETEDVKTALRKEIPDLNSFLEKGQFTIITHTGWYLEGDNFDSDRVLNYWSEKLNHALDSGYDGLRIAGDVSWLEKENWYRFIEYEKQLNNLFNNCQMIALCTYSVDRCNITEIIDVVANHQFALVKKEGDWECTRNSEWERADQKRKQADKSLQASEECYRSIYENSLDGILLTKPDGTILCANPQACQMFGMTEEEIVRMGREGVVVNDEKLAAALKNRDHTGCMRAELTYKRKDGTTFVCDTTSKIFVDADGSVYTSLIFRDISERKQIEEVLRQSEEKYRIVADNTYDWEFWINSNGLFLYMSPSCERVTGYPARDFLDNPDLLQKIIHPEDRQVFLQHQHEKSHSRRHGDLEFRIVTKDGMIRWIHHLCQPIYDSEGRYAGCRGSNRDITERKRTEEEGQRSRNMIQLIMDNIPQGIFWKDHDSIYLGCNKFFSNAAGLESTEHIIGKNDYELPWLPEQAEWFRECDRRIMENDTPEYRIEEPQRVADGKIVWLETNKIPLHDVKGNVIGILGTYEDITGRKQAEEALRVSNIYNRSLIEASLDPLVTIGPDGKITDVNGATEQVTGYSRNELIGTDFSDYFTEPEKARTGYQQVFMDGKVRDYPLDIRHKDGHTTPVLYNASVYRDENGKVIGVFAAARDITERKRVEEALLKSEKFLRLAQVSSGAGIWNWDMSSDKLEWSEELFRLFGLDPEKTNASFDSWRSVLHPDDRLMAESRIEEAINNHTPLKSEYRIMLPSGDVRWINALGNTTYDVGWKPKSMSGICIDITESKKAEEALIEEHKKLEEAYELLTENEKRLSEAQRIAHIGSFDWNFVTNKICRSEEFYRIYGRTPQELSTYSKFLACVHPDDRDYVYDNFKKALDGKSYCIDYRIILPDGEERIIHAKGEVIFDEKNNPVSLKGTNQDITEQKKVEKELKLANDYNRSLIEASLDPLVTIGPNGKITDVNRSTVIVTGYSRAELIGTDFSDYFTDPEKANKGYKQVFKNGSIFDYELEIENRNGSITPVLYNASVYKDESGEVIGVFAAARDITERKKAEEALKKANDTLEEKVKERTVELEKSNAKLKESEKHLSEAQRIAHLGNYDNNLVSGKVYWSDELYHIFGLEPQEGITFDKFLTFIHPDDKDYVNNAIIDAIDGKHYAINYRIVRPDGEVRIVHSEREAIFDKTNKPIRAIGTIQDVTENRKAEEKIWTLANAVESSSDAIITESLDCIITSWNKAAEQIYGYSAEEVLGKNASILEPDSIKGEIKSHADKIRHGKRVQNYETIRLRKDGNIINVSVTLSPILNASEEIVAISAIVRDITERKREEEALRESEARLRRFYESDMFGVIYFSMDGSIIDANDKFLEIIGYTREDLKAGRIKKWRDLTPPEYHILDEQCIKELETTGHMKKPYEKEYICNDGSRVPVILGAAAFNDERREGIAFAIDITEHKRAEKALAEIDRIRIKEIHHRIKNNLQVISSLLDLQAEKFQDEDVLEAFKESQNRVVSMSLIHEELYKGGCNDQLDFSAYLRKLAESLFQTYNINSKNIHLDMDMEEDAFFDMDIAVPLGIIVNELVSNSLKHAFNKGEKGEIRIRLCREGQEIINDGTSKSFFSLTISDSGEGIPEDLEFDKIESLGLQLVNALVDQLDGTIEIKRNHGTEFRVTFMVMES